MERIMMTVLLAAVLVLSVGYLASAEGQAAAPEEATVKAEKSPQAAITLADGEIKSALPARKSGKTAALTLPEAGIKTDKQAESVEIDYQMLVNSENPLPGDYQPEIVEVPGRNAKGEKKAGEALCEMLKAGERDGMRFVVCSGYRTQDDQRKLYLNQIQKKLAEGLSEAEAVAAAEKFSALPGYSEHETGLAFDIVALSYQNLDEGYAETAEAKWLLAHAEDYGFVLRYPKEKEKVTGISYEPWHYRYVGRVASRAITRGGITLEEYKALTNRP